MVKNVAMTERRSDCAIACSLDIVGDKWTLLVVRDLMHGRSTFGELLESPERIQTSILADRLKRLQEAGLVSGTPYQERPVRYAYSLTPQGMALGEVLRALLQWGKQNFPGTKALKR